MSETLKDALIEACKAFGLIMGMAAFCIIPIAAIIGIMYLMIQFSMWFCLLFLPVIFLIVLLGELF